MIFRFKNLFIIFLVFLAIFQTKSLWFEGYPYHSFFSFFSNSLDVVSLSSKINYAMESILINNGDNKFLRQYNNFSKTEYKKTFDEAIIECISKGKFKYEQSFDIDYLLQNKCVIYNFTCDFFSNELESIFGMKLKGLQDSFIFNKIALVPTISNSIEIKVIFLNSNTNDAYIFTLEKHNLAENLYYTIDNFSNFEVKYYYSVLDFQGEKLYQFKSFFDAFLPKITNDLYVNKIGAYNPLEQEGGILLSGLEKYIDIFFDNHAIKWNSTIDETYTYKDDNTVVKYYTNDVLEYVNYKTSPAKNESPYEIALNFLEKDTNIKNEYYLKNYEKTDDQGIIFYFDYKLNNFPIELSEDIKNQTDMQSIIEITVFENKVSKYKRLVYNFYIKDQKSLCSVSLLDVFNNVLNKTENLEQKLQSFNLQYTFNDLESVLPLSWKIKTENGIYFESIEDSENIWTGN